MFALPGGLRGSFLLRITSLVARIFARRQHRSTYFFITKSTQKLVAFHAKRRHQTHQVSPGRRYFFNDEKYPNSRRFRQPTKVFASQSSANIERLQTYRLPFVNSLQLLNSQPGIRYRHKVEPSASCE